ncbi:hypothetical protein B9Z65_8389 [Elsinoe australis]|uniref:Uncharacterized protein n=1 Tax=Elsinoe australis TaxID=40998 RepID=A0A2P7YDL7_9PEZI|nr:hypothetical protein B9Z65_8389 [Elsinoe australis]
MSHPRQSTSSRVSVSSSSRQPPPSPSNPYRHSSSSHSHSSSRRSSSRHRNSSPAYRNSSPRVTPPLNHHRTSPVVHAVSARSVSPPPRAANDSPTGRPRRHPTVIVPASSRTHRAPSSPTLVSPGLSSFRRPQRDSGYISHSSPMYTPQGSDASYLSHVRTSSAQDALPRELPMRMAETRASPDSGFGGSDRRGSECPSVPSGAAGASGRVARSRMQPIPAYAETVVDSEVGSFPRERREGRETRDATWGSVGAGRLAEVSGREGEGWLDERRERRGTGGEVRDDEVDDRRTRTREAALRYQGVVGERGWSDAQAGSYEDGEEGRRLDTDRRGNGRRRRMRDDWFS